MPGVPPQATIIQGNAVSIGTPYKLNVMQCYYYVHCTGNFEIQCLNCGNMCQVPKYKIDAMISMNEDEET